ncbi:MULTISPECIES: hypothetical protein [unclassified Streptomyces]|uniref:hypothetical protein n=1 Tax=unclassified Streptomyces TaxID=2593676 RepID=UPI0029B15B19|nr:hypothetical protein [Streptomyces sp. DK15]MDX2392088.1 hypothetical protein [Streptomyces sp. DK15]
MDIKKTPAPTAPEAAADAVADTAAGTPAAPADTTVEGTPAAGAPADADASDGEAFEHAEDSAYDDDDEAAAPQEHAGVGSAASAIVAAGLGLVALSGSWVSRVIAERQTLIGQIESANAATAKEKIAALYGDAWHMTALVNGVLSTLALLIAVFVLARPAFGAPGRVLPVWIRSVSWAAVALGLLGVLLFGLMYFDVLVPMPTAAE